MPGPFAPPPSFFPPNKLSSVTQLLTDDRGANDAVNAFVLAMRQNRGEIFMIGCLLMMIDE